MSYQIKRFPTNDELIEQLADEVADKLQTGVRDRGDATIAVSGGSTPESLFRLLAGRAIPWAQVTVTLVDERWVEPDHPDSNARLVAETLLQDKAAAAQFVPLKTKHDDPFIAQPHLGPTLQTLSQPFDVVLLGMGDDGHTASFFPGADTLAEALDINGSAPCIGVKPPVAPHDRMTLTLPTLLNTRFLALHIIGQQKNEVLERAMTEKQPLELPISAVIEQDLVPLNIYHAASR